MLIPRFTIKILLIITTVAALFSLVLSQALRGGLEGIFLNSNFAGRRLGMVATPENVPAHGEPWAAAVMFTCAAVGLVFLLFLLFWALGWIWEETVGAIFRRPARQPSNPFASAGPPKQIIPPTEPQ
ncbi:hypothetical protein NA78x_006289 [Anatilimnocola sp. NA78]|uniref:hypothetical protein n=1 Tax=Anatilimnocola sp. NA78 TaxID=3415683 RepID=UPI003CE4D3EE